MPKEYTKEDLWKLYEKLPQELKEAIFAESTADNIWKVCEANEIEDVSKVAKYSGQVLLGILPPDEFEGILGKELKMNKELAKKVNREIFRFIFYPVKTILEDLYKKEIAPPAGSTIIPSTDKPPRPPQVSSEEKPEKIKKDAYREIIE